MSASETSANSEETKRSTRIWQVEWQVGHVPSIYNIGKYQPEVRRQYFANPEDADKFKKSLVAAAALLGTGVSPVLSEAEVK